MGNLMYGVKNWLKKSLPTILSILGSAGVIGTAVLAAKATPVAVEQLKAYSRHEHSGDPNACTPLEAVRVCWKSYIPAATVGLSTIACVIGANALNKKQQSVITGAYIFLDNACKKYKAKVAELFGESANDQVKTEIAKDDYRDIQRPLDTNNGMHLEDGMMTFYESHLGRFFERTLAEVINAEYQLNRYFTGVGEVTLNQFYYLLDLPETELGETLGWSIGAGAELYGYQWIDFQHEIFTLDDGIDVGLECCYIEMPFPPTADYSDY